MGARGYFWSAALVAALAYGGWYGYKHVGLPDWYFEARMPLTIERLDASDTARLKEARRRSTLSPNHLPAQPRRAPPCVREAFGARYS